MFLSSKFYRQYLLNIIDENMRFYSIMITSIVKNNYMYIMLHCTRMHIEATFAHCGMKYKIKVN